MSAEEWRPVPGFGGRYDVSNLGRLRSWLPYRGKPLPHVRDLPVGDQGYRMVNLRKPGGGMLMRKLHVLVAAAFLGPRPEGMETRHLNGDKLDNRAENLSYGTKRENTLDRRRHGQNPYSNRTHCPQGHPYSEENTRIVRVRGEFRHRACKTCEAAYQARRKAQLRGVA